MKAIFTYSILGFLCLPLGVLAQDKKVDFFGSGRFSLNNSNLSGKLIETDTTTARKQMTGYSLFDLGFHIRPNEETEIKAITRVSNDINGFWGAGITFYLRELYLRGLMFKRIRYQVGDLNTKMTPYTLYNPEGELYKNNPLAFNTFTEVINYDKFYGTNSWRQQGATADMGFDFDKLIDHLHVKGLITKNRQTDYFSTPDRLLAGATVEAKAFKQLTLSYNLTSVFDVKQSAMFSDAQFKNKVHSFGASEKIALAGLDLNLLAEFGKSTASYEGVANVPTIPDGSFLDAGFALNNKLNTWQISASYRSVETSFRSMGAQSRRVDYSNLSTEYPYYTNRESQRPVTILEVLTDEAYYNMFLSPGLKNYNPAYENMLPYGKATPNRQGGEVKLGWNTSNKQLLKLGADAAVYNEITGQGTTNLRSFTNIEFYADLGLNELYKGKKKLHVGAYMRNQNTQRSGNEGIDKISLKSTQVKLGVEYEIIPKLEFQVAAILLQASGNEYIAERNGYNEITFYNAFKADLNETLLLGGINYQFSKNNCLKLQFHQMNWDNQLLPNNQYKINRFAVLYNLFF
ncbi:MAG: hypothetical protein K9H61_12800 [Bacteroidia bacterium]|nr:hypothetical protein [Bacteroidia bacterium]MCF8428155.1 hypothetical protein [Bacteroidia bacterium]MCF8447862.1 hypothetical protein [Bacteroidia bacterium]